MIRYMTAGESHGEMLLGIADGFPSNIVIDQDFINRELAKRMAGYGRGKRMSIEKDKVKIVSGVRKNKTTGSPIGILIKNKDFSIGKLSKVTNPRPGHADLSGALKFDTDDARNILERASARETAVRVAVGAIAKLFLSAFKIKSLNHVLSVGSVSINSNDLSFSQIENKIKKSVMRCVDKDAEKMMKFEIDQAREDRDTLGGICEVRIVNAPVGLGSMIQWDKKIDGKLAKALMSIQAVKAVGFGLGFSVSTKLGSQTHDAIYYSKTKGFYRNTNNAGGVEGGITNGGEIIVNVAMKPISTLMNPLDSVNLVSKNKARASVERSDICAVPACGVVSESVCMIEMADAMLEKFGGDSINETRRNYLNYMKQVRRA